jgi:hypothetical protein
MPRMNQPDGYITEPGTAEPGRKPQPVLAPGNEHDYRDRFHDCDRPLCRAYREGYSDGFGGGAGHSGQGLAPKSSWSHSAEASTTARFGPRELSLSAAITLSASPRHGEER